MRLALLAALLLTAACEGPVGPMGPAGPQGPPGPTGQTWFYGGVLNSAGDVSIYIPPEAGTITRLPQVTCYIASNANGPWSVLADDYPNQIFCGVARDAASGQLFVYIVSGYAGSPGWIGYVGYMYQIVVRAQTPA